MECIRKSELKLIAKGSHSEIYQYLKPYGQYGLNMAVKMTTRPRFSIENLNLLNSIGCNKIYAELCSVEGKEAIFMENLYTDDVVYVFPNTYRNKWEENKPEVYLNTHKLKGISNMSSLLYQLRELAHACDSKGIELQIDMLSFGICKAEKTPNVMYKVADVDCMMQDDGHIFKLSDNNICEAKWALEIFVKYCVDESAQEDLLQQIKDFKW